MKFSDLTIKLLLAALILGPLCGCAHVIRLPRAPIVFRPLPRH